MAEASSVKRTPRSSDMRESSDRSMEKRDIDFDPSLHSEMLPTPKPQDGWDFRYVRVLTRGEVDSRNYANALRTGWEPVSRADVPELDYVLSDVHHPLAEQLKDSIMIGGLILCKRPVEYGEKLRAAAQTEQEAQIKAIEDNYLNDQDRRMPKFSDSRTKVQFGN